MSLRSKKIVALLAGVLVLGGVSVATAPAANATTAGCTQAGPTVKDPNGTVWHTKNCTMWTPAYTEFNAKRRALMYTGTNWVTCQMNLGSQNPVYGGHHNTWWVWTEGDSLVAGAPTKWGWFPETAISQGQDNKPIPGVPVC